MQALLSTHAARALLPGPEGCEHAVGAALGAVVAAAAAAASTLTMLTSATLARVAGSAWLPRVSERAEALLWSARRSQEPDE